MTYMNELAEFESIESIFGNNTKETSFFCERFSVSPKKIKLEVCEKAPIGIVGRSLRLLREQDGRRPGAILTEIHKGLIYGLGE